MVCAIALSSGVVTPAHATQANYNAVACLDSDESLSDLVRTAAGIATLSAVDTPRFVTCSVPYTASHEFPGAFVLIDGDNKNHAQTSCTISSYNPSGILQASQSVTLTAATYEEGFALSDQQVGSGNNYLSLTCLLPARGNGLLRGILVLQ
jgi:hypothetical protein